MGYPGLARARDERLAERVKRRGLRGRQRAQRSALRARHARREKNLGAADREGERADCRALHEGASFDVVHGSSSLAPDWRSCHRHYAARSPSTEETGDSRCLLE